jgi:hypothetical protein
MFIKETVFTINTMKKMVKLSVSQLLTYLKFTSRKSNSNIYTER